MFALGFPIGIVFGVFAVSTWFLYQSVFRIVEGHRGILISFGRAQFIDPEIHLLRTYGPGLHFKWPWQKVHSVSLMEQSLDLSGKEGGINAMASDGTILRLDSKLRYTPVVEELYDFIFAMREPIQHIRGLFTCLLRNEIANFKSDPGESDLENSSSFSVIRSKRRLLNRHIEQFTHDKIDGRYGVRFNAVDLTDIYPPDELAEALNAVFSAKSMADTAYARAEAESQNRILSAHRGVAIAAERAKASETEVLTLAEYLRELKHLGMLNEYIERRRAEATYESRTVYVRRAV